MARSLVFRIRKLYFDAIVSGEKTTEFRPDTQFWRSRIDGKGVGEDWVAVFICLKMKSGLRCSSVEENMFTAD